MKPPLRGKGMTGGWQMRQDNRAPTKIGRVTRGFRAGLPHRDQTNTRDHLTWQDALVLVDAEQFAAQQGLPLTTFLTVAWKHYPGFSRYDVETWKDALIKLRLVAREYLAKHDIPAAWVFANERAMRVGGHTHFLLHMPKRRWRGHAKALEQHLRTRCDMTSPFAIKITASTAAGSINPRQRLGVINPSYSPHSCDSVAGVA
jgi:hypothetical protein